MASQTNFHHFLALIPFLLFFFSILPQSQSGGFSVDLIHRDSPNSPLFNPSISPSDRLKNVYRRRLSNGDTVASDDVPNGSPYLWNYLVKVSVGTPPREMHAYIDTNTDLTWIQCQPCENCFPQDPPAFNGNSSATYRPLPCRSEPCRGLKEYESPRISCKETTDTSCQYDVSYNYNASSSGNIAIDTLTLNSVNGGTTAFSNTLFGCGRDDSGPFLKSAVGVLGLGGGKLSIVNQLEESVRGKFSYCLPEDRLATSKLSFGDSAKISGKGVVTTPLMSGTGETMYRVTLQGIVLETIAANGLKSFNSMGVDKPIIGNTIIDLSTTITRLPTSLYGLVEDTLRRFIRATPIPNPPEPFTLCYKTKFVRPTVIYNFTASDGSAGALLKLSRENSFLDFGDIGCWAVVPTDDQFAVFGSLSQVNFLVSFDLFKNRLSFKRSNCADV